VQRVRVVVVDDHALFRAGLVGLLADMPEFQVVGEASNGEEAVLVVERTRPDVILMDVNMPVMNGLQAVERISKHTSAHIIMLTISRQEDDLFTAIAAGADGYLLKNAEPEELRKAILNIVDGKSVLSPEVTRPVLKALVSASFPLNDKVLSKREIEVLDCLARGLTTTQIAAQLFVSENTIKTHIRHILEKLGASNRAEAVSKAGQMGLLDFEN
jgi:DNA-binding NarL/FixJ family response regulator